MSINFNNEFIKRFTTSLILIFLLIGTFSIGNNGIYLMVIILSFLSFLEIYNISKSKLIFHYFIPFFILLYFFDKKSEIFNLFEQFRLMIFYCLSSFLIVLCLFKKSNIHFSIVGFLINSTFFSIIHIIENQNLE